MHREPGFPDAWTALAQGLPDRNRRREDPGLSEQGHFSMEHG